MDKKSLVILRGSKELIFGHEVFRPLTFYRSIEAGKDVRIVYGEPFLEHEMGDFELAYDKIMRDWELMGLVVGGKAISKKAFTELIDVRVYGKQTQNLRIGFVMTNPKECLYGFYPMYNENKAKQVANMYGMYLSTIEGDMNYVDQEYIQFGNCGTPLSNTDLRKRY
jgi:hypothetical protein